MKRVGLRELKNRLRASELALVEPDRILVRAVTLKGIVEATAAERRAHLNAAAARWHRWRLSSDVLDRARRPSPAEPMRVGGHSFGNCIGDPFRCLTCGTAESRRSHPPIRGGVGIPRAAAMN